MSSKRVWVDIFNRLGGVRFTKLALDKKNRKSEIIIKTTVNEKKIKLMPDSSFVIWQFTKFKPFFTFYLFFIINKDSKLRMFPKINQILFRIIGFFAANGNKIEKLIRKEIELNYFIEACALNGPSV